MLRKLLLAPMMIALAAAYSAGQDTQPPPPPSETPGATLRPEPLRVGTVAYPGYSSRDTTGFVFRAQGFSVKQRLYLWLQKLDSTEGSRVEAVVDAAGLVHAVTRENAKEGILPFLLMVHLRPKGMTYRAALATQDGTIRAWTRFTPFPIEAQDGRCRASAGVEKGLGEAYLVSANGFQPGEELKIHTAWEKEELDSLGRIRDDGTWQGLINLAEPRKKSLKAKVILTGQSCKVVLSLERLAPTKK